ncbi:hypothetical protein [Nonomuraea sp. NPDC049709]|uniref:hypothetical protein n=1 Tax=Nonomuraea sp. NPDC049709 TaxID=3154736 RepID=UPI00341B7126
MHGRRKAVVTVRPSPILDTPPARGAVDSVPPTGPPPAARRDLPRAMRPIRVVAPPPAGPRLVCGDVPV